MGKNKMFEFYKNIENRIEEAKFSQTKNKTNLLFKS